MGTAPAAPLLTHSGSRVAREDPRGLAPCAMRCSSCLFWGRRGLSLSHFPFALSPLKYYTALGAQEGLPPGQHSRGSGVGKAFAPHFAAPPVAGTVISMPVPSRGPASVFLALRVDRGLWGRQEGDAGRCLGYLLPSLGMHHPEASRRCHSACPGSEARLPQGQKAGSNSALRGWLAPATRSAALSGT